jgi:2,5-diketo-D-gluconate reductase B
MVHWPSPDMNLPLVLEAMQGLLDQGLTRAIGVCNFTIGMLKTAIEDVQAPIACLQVEYHPFLGQARLRDYVRSKGIPLVAYAPLAQGRAATDPVLERIGTKHGATAAQIALAWLLEQDGVIAIPKAQRRESQLANLDALNITLDAQDRAAIAALPKDQRFVRPAFAPEWDD